MKRLFLIYLLMCVGQIYAQESFDSTFVVTDDFKHLLIDRYHYYEDKQRDARPAEFYNDSIKLIPTVGVKNFGFSSSVFWQKFKIRNELNRPREIYISFHYPNTDEIKLFLSQNGKTILEKKGGDRYPFAQRDVVSRFIVFKVTLAAKRVD